VGDRDGRYNHSDGIAGCPGPGPRAYIPINSNGRLKVKAESIINAKGQTTLPADIMALVGAEPGTSLVWSAMPDGTILVWAKIQSILDLSGLLRAPKGKRVSIDNLNPWR
jgi:bifunctional DNA-binding transcriptional regulator/antitoxin component of YhaV-PrlF toxin-antitoxin module